MTGHRHADPVRRSGRWVRFVRRYGWRAYALPLLSVITVAALVHDKPGDASTRSPSRLTATHDFPTSATPTPTSTGGPDGSDGSVDAASTGSNSGVEIEGLTNGDAAFAAGLTPAPVVIKLGTDATSCATNSYGRLVVVSISKQHLWACQGSKQVNDTAVTTGATVDHDQTPLGSWRVQAKERDRYLIGPGYKDYVHYWVPFNGDFGLHDAPWQTMPFGSKNWPTEGSHGCVHVPTKTMAWLYRWASVGSTVVTIEG